MKPFVPHENGGIKGHVLFTPTRPFDDPALLLQLGWAPGIPNVKVNLYKEDIDALGAKHLELVDTTRSTSWDNFAQGFRMDANGIVPNGLDGRPVANMNCPGQETTSPFYFTMQNGTMPLDPANRPISSGGDRNAPGGRFKCYDGWSMLTQVQPAPYDGKYKFPSVVAKATARWRTRCDRTDNPCSWIPRYKTNCTICTANPDDGTPMLPAGKYVVEVVVPEGFELVKEEDKNILLGDAFTAPVTQQFADFGAIFIMPDQAAVNALFNAYNLLQPTANNGAGPRREGDTGSIEVFWPCVGDLRIVPDLNSIAPGAEQQAAFAGATRPLCDRKEVTLEDQMTVLAKFYLFTSAHIAAHFTGIITNDFASEFDPFSPQFGEKFAVPNVPVAFRDFTGKEISRVYADQWGAYNGVTFSSWTVNPPSPSGYTPTVMIACMNDPGPIDDPANPGQKITDPAYNPAYSNFCYEWPFMPGLTAHMDTPVVPTMAFAAGYNLPDCEYPDATPAIKEVNSDTDGIGPWVAAANNSAAIASVTLTGTGGSGYASLPTVDFTGGGSGATASLTGRVSGVTVTGGSNTRGSGYTGVASVELHRWWWRQRRCGYGLYESGLRHRGEPERFLHRHRHTGGDHRCARVRDQWHHVRAGNRNGDHEQQQPGQRHPPCHGDQLLQQWQWLYVAASD